MNDNTRKFFEKLTDFEEGEEKPNLETRAVKAEKKSSKKEEARAVKEEPVKEEKSGAAGVSRDFGFEEFDEGEGQLAIDVYQTSDEIVIESAIAGVGVDNLDIEITAESVTIKGRRYRQDRIKKEDYLYQECYWGSFSRSVILPQEIDPDEAVASLKSGILRIVLPKINKARSKKLKVKFE